MLNLLSQGGPLIFVVIFFAGVFTSISPCIMGMVPVVLGYIGAYGKKSAWENFILSLSLVLGLATSFAILGVIAALFGSLFGKIGNALPIIIGAVAIIMGLDLMKLISIHWHGISKLPVSGRGIGGAYIVGLFFGLAASPCATAVLAIVLAYASSGHNYLTAGALLFTYGFGHGLPLLIAGTFVGALKGMKSFAKYWDYFAYVAGLLFIGVGVYIITLAL